MSRARRGARAREISGGASKTEAILPGATTNPVGLVAKPQGGGPCLGHRTSARRAPGHRFRVMVIPIVTELPLALEPTTRDDFLGPQAAPRTTPASRIVAVGSRA